MYLEELTNKPGNKSITVVMNYDELNLTKDEIGIVFSKVLEDAGVFKRDEKGQAAFIKFIEYVNK